jgi:hypothetical protein
VTKYFYWTSTNTNYRITEDMLVAPVDQDLHTPLRSNADTVIESHWYPRVDVVIPKATSGLTPYWWLGSTIYLNVVWDVDSTFPAVPIDIGARDPRVMGAVSLNPVPMIYDTGFDASVIYRCPEDGLKLKSRRKGSGADIIPTVHGQVWGFDHYGVLNGSHSAVDVRYLSMISSVLWGTDVPPA